MAEKTLLSSKQKEVIYQESEFTPFQCNQQK